MKTVGVVAAAAVTTVAAVGLAFAVGATAWRRATALAVGRLLDVSRQRSDGLPTEHAVVLPPDLPAPVARYFELVLPRQAMHVRTARIRWSGEFRMRSGGDWSPFDAEQHFTAWPPGFVWDARIRMLPFVPVRVRDGYLAGRGTMLGRLGALLTVVNQAGTREMAASALARWLGEAVWFPTALLPRETAGGGVSWNPVDDSTARATVTDGSVTASAEFRFAPTGEITGMSAMRYRDVDGTGVLTPFEGSYRDHARRDGVMVPSSAEVAWLLPDGRFAYWRGRLVDVEYEGTAAPGASTWH